MWDNFFEKFGSVVSKYYMQLLSGLKTTLIIAFSAFAIGVVLGTIIAIVKVTPKYRNWFLKILEKIFDVYVTVVRGTPVVVQLLLMYFGLLAGSMLTSTESGTSFTSSSGRVAVTTSSEHVSPTVEHSCPFSFISVKPVSTL